jgi:hypothetical protein
MSVKDSARASVVKDLVFMGTSAKDEATGLAPPP